MLRQRWQTFVPERLSGAMGFLPLKGQKQRQPCCFLNSPTLTRPNWAWFRMIVSERANASSSRNYSDAWGARQVHQDHFFAAIIPKKKRPVWPSSCNNQKWHLTDHSRQTTKPCTGLSSASDNTAEVSSLHTRPTGQSCQLGSSHFHRSAGQAQKAAASGYMPRGVKLWRIS